MSDSEYFEGLLDESDKQFINKQNLGEKMEQTYNKVQYSEFTPDRVGQWVLRGDTLQEVLDLKKELAEKLSVGKPVMGQTATVVTGTLNVPPGSIVASTPQTPQPPSDPSCPVCGGAMWNNIPKKRSGEYNLNRPDYACKNKQCKGAIWPPKDRRGVVADGSNY